MDLCNCDRLTYMQRIEALSKGKAEQNELKIKLLGYQDFDDYGSIPWTEPIPFKTKSNHHSGGCYGARCIGENFKAWLEAHPVYINPMSSLAGAWVSVIPGIGGWKPEDLPVHLYPMHEKYNITASGIGAMNHLGPDMRIGLEMGWGGLLEKIRYFRDFNKPLDTSFYDGEEALVLGIQSWISKHAVKAKEMAQKEKNPVLKENLLSIGNMNEWLVYNPPRTLREACQFLAWFQSVDRMWATGGALGQLDELLRPYYEADMKAGLEDDEAVIWHIASLMINDTHYSQIGGPAPDGHDLTSRLSYLILEAGHRLKIPYNLAVRVHDGLDPLLLRRAITYLMEDGTGASFSCSKGVDEGFRRNGVPLGLARMRAKVGCNWTALPGIEYSLQDVTRQCLTAPFVHAFHDVVGDMESPRNMEALWERYIYHLGISVDIMKQGFDWHMEHQADNTPEIVLNLFCHGPIERGMDVSNGGVDLYNIAVDGVGLATVADSFAAVEQRVVDEKKLSFEELAKHLENDYAGAEDLRLMMKNIPRYGCGGSRADWWAKRISEAYTHLVKDTPTPDGYNVIPGLFSHGNILNIGKNLPATPNGRHAGEAVSHSADPDPGFMREGISAPTAKANAVASVQPGWGNSAPLQLDIDRHLLYEQGGIDALETIIKVHNDRNGTLINLNVVSKEEILEAHKDPLKYPDLIVRVTGYSAYFKSLSPEYRQQVVDRILSE